MTGWWVIFVFQLIEKLPDDTDMTRFKNMIFWEGSIGMILILCAGTALAFYVIREKKQAQRFRAFCGFLYSRFKDVTDKPATASGKFEGGY